MERVWIWERERRGLIRETGAEFCGRMKIFTSVSIEKESEKTRRTTRAHPRPPSDWFPLLPLAEELLQRLQRLHSHRYIQIRSSCDHNVVRDAS